MLARLFSCTLVSIDATPVEVEVDVSPTSMPRTVLVGLAKAAVRENSSENHRAIIFRSLAIRSGTAASKESRYGLLIGLIQGASAR